MVRSLLEANLLGRYVSGGVDSYASPVTQWARSTLRRASPPLDRALRRRSVDEIPRAYVRARWGWEVARLAARQCGAIAAEDWCWEHQEHALDRHCARLLRTPGLSGYLGVEHGALASIQAARALGKPAVLAYLSPHHQTRQAWVDAELDRHPEWQRPGHARIRQRAASRDRRGDAEMAAADWLLSNSSFTTRSLVEAGAAADRILTVPLGGPDPIAAADLPDRVPDRVLFLYAGPVSIRKGAHVLLEAWRLLAPSGVELHFYGQMLAPDGAIADAQRAPGGRGLVFHGSVGPEELRAAYRSASILILPTLCDGFGLVVSEALAQGLPVITTRNAGAADLVTEGRSGFVVPAGDIEALARAMQWCLDHPHDIGEMRVAALQTATRWTWRHFRRVVSAEMRRVFGGDDSRASHCGPAAFAAAGE
jgi:glycosyltransferase involved in cell wall biosynthesis